MIRTRIHWKVREHTLTIGERTLIMGVLNVTPDSFSDGGKYFEADAAVEKALELEAQGADILDIGAESTRPGSERVNAGEELRRLVPVLKKLKGRLSIPIAVDTYKAEVAEKALEHGASIINDVSALTWEPDIVKPVVQYDAGLILNHMRGTPETWARMAPMKDVMGTLLSELEAAIHRAVRAGVPRDRLVIDPGIGFGKRGEQNHEILARLGELSRLLIPVLVAASRKSFLGKTEDAQVLEYATAAAVTTAILHGAAIVRVHDVAAMRPVVQTADAIIEATPEREEKPARSAVKTRPETIEEKRRKPIRPVIRTEAPVAEQPPPPVAPAREPESLPRRPFERRPPTEEDRPKREDRQPPTKKFFEWRKDEGKGKPADRRARPDRDSGEREDRRPPRRDDDRKPVERRGVGRPFNKPAFGKPAAGKPAFNKPSTGKPAFNKPSTGKPAFNKPAFNKPRDGEREERSGGDRPPRRPFKRAENDRPDRRPPGGRPAFSPRDGQRPGAGRPSGPRKDSRPDSRGGERGSERGGERGGARPPAGRGGPKRPPFGGPPKRGGGGSAPPRGPRKRS